METFQIQHALATRAAILGGMMANGPMIPPIFAKPNLIPQLSTQFPGSIPHHQLQLPDINHFGQREVEACFLKSSQMVKQGDPNVNLHFPTQAGEESFSDS